ncbi:MAG: sulfite exporter TauE/SafE family protein [Dehalococcoidia bacterium]|nr:sulfite exporter TauE/SafE family protein [Dehalococcoidia bacterium]
MDLLGFATGINIPLISAFLLGLLATIGPCTMATNIAAVAYISRRLTDRKYAIMTGTLYTLGRMFTYSVLGILLIVIGLNTPGVSTFLQIFGEKAMGPFLIAIGLILLFIDRVSFGRGSGKLSAMGGKVADWGMIGGFPLGALFALAFCPVSATLFFMVLIPLALKSTGGVILPAMFAVGTGLPVLVFGTLLSLGIAGVATWLNAVTRVEKIVRVAMSIVFIAIGVYYIISWINS